MVLSQPLSTWINSRLQNNALSVIGIFMFLFALCASSTVASAQPGLCSTVQFIWRLC